MLNKVQGISIDSRYLVLLGKFQAREKRLCKITVEIKVLKYMRYLMLYQSFRKLDANSMFTEQYTSSNHVRTNWLI